MSEPANLRSACDSAGFSEPAAAAHFHRQGYQAHDAQDLTQSFFARLLEKHTLDQVDREKGKFRSGTESRPERGQSF